MAFNAIHALNFTSAPGEDALNQATFAAITHPSPFAHPPATCIPAPAPSIHDMYEAMDWTAEYAALAQVCAPRPTDIAEVITRAEAEDAHDDDLRESIDNDTLANAIDYVLAAMKKKRGTWAPTIYETHIDCFMHDVQERAVELMRGAK